MNRGASGCDAGPTNALPPFRRKAAPVSPEHFDSAETRSQAEREATLFARLRELVALAVDGAPHYRNTLAAVEIGRLDNRAALADLPIIRKEDLIDLQETSPPLGGLATVPPGLMQRLFLSPGPIAEAQGRSGGALITPAPTGAGVSRARDHWRMARALFAAGFRPGDVVTNCFSYHLTPAGFMFDDAARSLGCAVFPGGVGNTETQAQAIERFAINGYVGTPDFLKIIMERAETDGRNLPGLTKGLVTGGPLFPDVAQWYDERGVHVRQCYGTAELGLIAYQSADVNDGFICDEDCIVEIVRPGTGQPVEDGEVGEVVVTTFDPHYPLIRLATGDLSAVLAGQSGCGRTNMRLKGWLGRADQTTKVKGMFVHPRQVARVIDAFDEVIKGRLEVAATDGRDHMTLHCETTAAADDTALAARIAETLQSETRLNGEVRLVAPGSLANDGKVIADLRTAG